MSTFFAPLSGSSISLYSSLNTSRPLRQTHPVVAAIDDPCIIEFNRRFHSEKGAHMGYLVSCQTLELDENLEYQADSLLPAKPIELWINWAGYEPIGYKIPPGSLGHLAKEVALSFQDFISKVESHTVQPGRDGKNYQAGRNGVPFRRLTLKSLRRQVGINWIADVEIDSL